jgi:ribosomal protein L40E
MALVRKWTEVAYRTETRYRGESRQVTKYPHITMDLVLAVVRMGVLAHGFIASPRKKSLELTTPAQQILPEASTAVEERAMILCMKCGTENRADALFSRSCGTRILRPEDLDTER